MERLLLLCAAAAFVAWQAVAVAVAQELAACAPPMPSASSVLAPFPSPAANDDACNTQSVIQRGQEGYCAAKTAPTRPLRVLLMTSSMPSHVFIAAKLARALAHAGHHVDLAAPLGKPTAVALEEMKDESNVTVVAIGEESKNKPPSERPVEDPSSMSTLIKSFSKTTALYKMLMALHNEVQESLYEPLLARLLDPTTRPHVAIGTHSMLSTVSDAAEKAGLPSLYLVGMPYDPALAAGLKGTSYLIPRPLVALPHTSLYPAVAPPGFAGLRQRFFMWLDAWLMKRAVRVSGILDFTAELRARRGLPPLPSDDTVTLFEASGFPPPNVSVIAMGGPPFISATHPVPPRYTLVGALEDDTTTGDGLEVEDERLRRWLDRAPSQPTVLLAFGTGVELSEAEASMLAIGLRELARHGVRMILSLRASEQKAHLSTFAKTMGEPSWVSEACSADGAVTAEYLGGALRVQPRVPQRALLQSGRIQLFLTHCGFGSLAEAFAAGVPMLAYPSGLDQPFNANRAVEAGAARLAPKGLRGLSDAVVDALADVSLREGAIRARATLRRLKGASKAVEAVERAVAEFHGV